MMSNDSEDEVESIQSNDEPQVINFHRGRKRTLNFMKKPLSNDLSVQTGILSVNFESKSSPIKEKQTEKAIVQVEVPPTPKPKKVQIVTPIVRTPQKVQTPNYDSFIEAKNYVTTTRIQCFKYNASLDAIVQKENAYQGFISLSNDGESLIITNQKPETGSNRQQAEQDIDKKYMGAHDGHVHNVFETLALEKQAAFEKEMILEDKLAMKNVISSCTCKLSEIEGFVYGGFSSRFWMLRKHISSMHVDNLDQLPFHSWNCLTIRLQRRDIDLVIRDDQQLEMLTKFLIYSLKTLDGKTNSANKLLEILNEERIEDYKKKTGL